MVRIILLLAFIFNIGCNNQTLTDRTLDSMLKCKQYCDKNFPGFKHVRYNLSSDGYLIACECLKEQTP